METQISRNPVRCLNSPLLSSASLFHFPSLSGKNRSFLHFSQRKLHWKPQLLNFSTHAASSASSSVSYGGWDDLRLFGDSDQSGESDQLRSFLISVGIDDRKYLFMFLMGFVCALAISRVRVSSIIVFPASVIVFAAGFSFGFVKGGNVSAVRACQSTRKSKDDNFRTGSEKLRNLWNFFDEFDVKLRNIKNSIEMSIEYNQITVADLQSYVKVMESVRVSALSARKVVEGSIDIAELLGGVVESNGVPHENPKPSRKRKEVGNCGFDFVRFFGGLFGENSLGLKTNKVKDIVQRENVETGVNDDKENAIATSVKENDLNFITENKGNVNLGFSQDTSNKPDMDQTEVEKLGNDAGRIKIISENGKMDLMEKNGDVKRHLDNEQYSYRNSRLQFMNNHRISLKMGHHNEIETWASHDSMLDSMDFSVSMNHMETRASFGNEAMLKNFNGAYVPHRNLEDNEKENYKYHFRKDRLNSEVGPHLADHQSSRESEVGSPSSSMVSDDMAFDRFLTEANDLLKQARECLRTGGDEEHAEIILYKSSDVLSQAIAMKPMSLLAVGQLGNTYLLHGELKLKISRQLRTLLSRSDPLFVEKQVSILKGLDDQLGSKDKLSSLLVNVCEECEELLVEAGRRYKMALSIDGNDMRALYNWGLALTFRAQLIADIGPEAAFDADKVFLAAIDKFNAMMLRSNSYAPDALFRWGVALQQRSRLRPRNSKEKVKLLQQAKRLYEDALHMDSGKLQLREALSSCLSELNLRSL